MTQKDNEWVKIVMVISEGRASWGHVRPRKVGTDRRTPHSLVIFAVDLFITCTIFSLIQKLVPFFPSGPSFEGVLLILVKTKLPSHFLILLSSVHCLTFWVERQLLRVAGESFDITSSN
ncbi:hypothetical protein K1719_028570 [Acacia pycnantha]|nr:hypothetical protein K1719_040756 [Acacia pycnantha]KAI9090717.1 hypothetical protein K1719_028570 [Acacia pycnantha]